MSIIKHVTLQKIVAHGFQYDPRISQLHTGENLTTHSRICAEILADSTDLLLVCVWVAIAQSV